MKRIIVRSLSILLTAFLLSGSLFLYSNHHVPVAASNTPLIVGTATLQDLAKHGDVKAITELAKPVELAAPTDKGGGLYEFAYNAYAKCLVGDKSKGNNFVPDMQLFQWDSVHWIDLGLTGLGKLNGNAINNNKLRAANTDYDVSWTPTPVLSDFNELGGMDLNISILKKTNTDKFVFSFTASNIQAYLQPSLTQEYKVGQTLEDGKTTVKSVTDTDVTDSNGNVVAHRPDYVVNSLAFYATDAGGMVTAAQSAMYCTTGKVGNLYRMEVVGSDGTWAWLDWSVSTGVITLTDTTGYIKAQNPHNYPLTIQPVGDTFGYLTEGSSQANTASSRTSEDPTAGAAGTGTSMTLSAAAASGTQTVQCGVYDNALSPSNKITNATTPDMTFTTTKSWQTANFASAPTFTAVNYRLVPLMTSGSSILWSYDYVTSGSYKFYQGSFATWPSTVTISNVGGSIKYTFSIYVTYTPGGGSTVAVANSPTTGKAFGTISAAPTYWAAATPTWPMTDGQCFFTITNSSNVAIDLFIVGTNPTGGVGATLVTSAPGTDQVNMFAYLSGASTDTVRVTIPTTSVTMTANVATSTTSIKWELAIVIGTPSDGVGKTSVVTISAAAH
jgi:hypothetical protein